MNRKKQKSTFPLTFTIAASGLSSMTAQLVMVREYFTLFSGNEFVIAMIFFSWLVSGALGCLSALLFEKKWPVLSRPMVYLGIICTALAAMPPVLIISVRLLRDLVFIHGTTPGFYPTFIFVLATLGPYSLIHGFALPFALQAARNFYPEYPGFLVLASDNIGDVLGGCMFSFVLVSLTSPVTALVLSSVLLLVSGAVLIKLEKSNLWVPASLIAAVFTVLCLVAEKPSLSSPYGEMIHYEESRFGRITVIDNNNQKTLFHDNIPTFTSENSEDAEQTVHYPLSQIEPPESVLVVSWKSGVTDELALYRPRSIDLVEIDPAITGILESLELVKKTPELNLIHTDARTYLTESDRVYDAIILNVSDPETFQTNRFFTQEFFQIAKKHLSPEGVLSFTMKGFDSYLAETEQQKLACLYKTASDVFSDVLAIPGNTVTFICSEKKLSWDIPALLTEKGITTKTIHGFFYGNVSESRVGQLHIMLTESNINHLSVNTDLHPVLINHQFREWFTRYGSTPYPFIIVTITAFLLYATRLNKMTTVLFTTGFTLMASEILVIFVFQIFFGHIYHHIGIMVTLFMAGLLPGIIIAEKTEIRRPLFKSDVFMVIFLFIFIFLIKIKAGRIFFLSIGLPLSVLCGFQFAHILKYSGDNQNIFSRAFSADLAGSGFGVLTTSLILIPHIGLIESIAVLIVIKSVSTALTGSIEKNR